MGGFGSGRKISKPKEKTSSTMQLHMRCLQKNNAVREGVYGTLELKNNAHSLLISCVMRECALELQYSISRRGSPYTAMNYDIPLEWTSCHYGGFRSWFLCPQCNRRAGILYIGSNSDFFLCRKCQNLTYGSQQENNYSRLIRRIYRYRDQLKMEGTLLNKTPLVKPKYMRTSRFIQLGLKLLKSTNDMVNIGLDY